MKVLFTGATGALGRKHCSLFPDTIQCSTRYSENSGYLKLIDDFKDADVLIHAAANINPRSIDDAIKDNAILPLDILTMASKINPEAHIILISSMSILGEDCEPKKMAEMTSYAASKYIMEELCFKVARNPVTIVRFSTLMYEDPDRDGLSKMVYSAATSGKVVAADCRRDFIPLWAACKWLNKLCGNKVWFNRTINLASGKSINMLDAANHLSRKYGISFHHTTLPDYTHVCYKFPATDAMSLEPLSFDIYKIMDEYYDKLKKGNNG